MTVGKTVVILSDFDIDNLKNYEYLIKESRSSNHLAMDKLIVLKNMVSYDEKVEKEMIVHVLDEAIKLTRLARDQNDTLTQYLAEVDR